MMSLFQQASNYNNHGINALLDGDEMKAIQAITASIKIFKAALVSIQEQEDEAGQVSSMDIDGSAKDGMTMSSAPATQAIVVPSMESSETIIFNRCIRIPTTTTSCCAAGTTTTQINEFNMTATDLNVYTSAAIYNLALAHQSIGSSLCMTKAEKLYGLVLKLLEGNDIVLERRDAVIVKLGSINNLSQIRYSNGTFEEFTSSLQACLQGFTSLGQDGTTAMTMLEEPEILGLLMNVLLLKPPSVASAA